MNAIIFDKLAYVDALQSSGISKEQAVAHASALDTAMREGTATSADITQLRHEIELQGAATKAEFDTVRAEFDAVRAEMKSLEQRMTIKLGGLMITGIVAVIALDRFIQAVTL